MCKISNLKENPFTKFSAEEELEILDSIFYKPSFYSGMRSLLMEGNSRSILGQRGQGKSVLVHKLNKDLVRKGCLPLMIHRYDGMPLSDNACHFLYKIVQSFTLELARKFVDQTLSISDVPKDLQDKFFALVELFYDKQWADSFVESMESIKEKKASNCFKRWINKKLINIVNPMINNVLLICGETIRYTILGRKGNSAELEQHKGIALQGFGLSEFKTLSLCDADKIDKNEYIQILKVLMNIVKHTHLKSVVVMFDKVDEFGELKSDVKAVSLFMKDILTDTDLLYTPKLGIVFSLWSEVSRTLNNMGVRFDKFPTIDIRWNKGDMEKIINKRLLFFSKNQEVPVTLNSLLPEPGMKDIVLELADFSPRLLIQLLGDINNCDHRESFSAFSADAIASGTMKFCKNFDYVSLRPFKIGGNSDLKDWINKLLAIRNNTFTAVEYASCVNVSKGTAYKHIESLQRLELIRKQSLQIENGAEKYEVLDPRIKFLMSRGVVSLD